MPLSDDAKLQVLHDHYKDTFSYTRDHIKSRDRFFLYALIILTLQFFQISSPSESSQALTSFIEKTIGFKLSIDEGFISSLLWFGLLSVVVRYFQTTVTVERQYAYVHKLEDVLSSLTGGDKLISREGHAYSTERPVFTQWMQVVYTWFFPSLLLATTLIKIIIEFPPKGQADVFYGFSVGFWVLIWVTTILYLLFRIREDKASLFLASVWAFLTRKW